MRPYAIALLAVAITAASAFASDLVKFKDWDESPQGYFMTSAEREQWKTVSTDAQAETFVAEFLAKRDPKFAAEVATRAQNADKYLSIGKTKGSRTLRGKVVILHQPATHSPRREYPPAPIGGAAAAPACRLFCRVKQEPGPDRVEDRRFPLDGEEAGRPRAPGSLEER